METWSLVCHRVCGLQRLSGMKSRGLLVFRTVVAGVLGVWFVLAASFSGVLLPADLRVHPGLPLAMRLFGIGWMVQAAYLLRHRRVQG